MKLIITLVLAVLGSLAIAAEHIVAQLAPDLSPKQVEMTVPVRLIDATADAPFFLFEVLPGNDIHVVQAQMRLIAGVIFAEDNIEVVMPEHHGAGKAQTIGAVGGDDPFGQLNKNLLAQIRYDEKLARQGTRYVRVAILDTGLSPFHGRLWRRTVASANFIEPRLPAWDVPRKTDSNGNNDPDEGAGHGTMVTGVIANLAPNASLIIARVADSDGTASAWTLIKGVAFAKVNGAELVNISLGSLDRIPAISDVLDWTEAHGLAIVAPIGNNNDRITLFPAGYSKVVCVSGVDPIDRKASFSNWDSDADAAAPATGIRSAYWDGGYAIWSGTSFAVPLVTGSLAAALQNTNRVDPDEIRDAVEESGDNIDGQNPDYRGKLGLRLNFVSLFLRIKAIGG